MRANDRIRDIVADLEGGCYLLEDLDPKTQHQVARYRHTQARVKKKWQKVRNNNLSVTHSPQLEDRGAIESPGFTRFIDRAQANDTALCRVVVQLGKDQP